MRNPRLLPALPLVLSACLLSSSCETTNVGGILDQVLGPQVGVGSGVGMGGLTNQEIVMGLKEALVVGTDNASFQASQPQGFYGNPDIRIPFPQDAAMVKTVASALGLGRQVSQFEQRLNAAAEHASAKAKPIFYDAVREMTITDALGILRGGESAATDYFRARTAPRLTREFRPVVDNAFADVQVAQFWSPLAGAYNQSPLARQPVDTDLVGYVTAGAIDGLFFLIADEERKIREDPIARVSDILRRVFGSAQYSGR